MRYYIFFIFLTIGIDSVLAQSSWQLKNDSMNLGILVSDYQKYTFEKGHFSIHQPCDNEDMDTLPFIVKYAPPLDFGRISFLYSKNLDTLFDATIVWMGMGKIEFPLEYLPADSFKIQLTNVTAPVSYQYFQLFSPDSLFQKKADSAWNAVKSLQVVKDFSLHPYRVGIYLYPPSVGAFVPSVAKWIIFLYRGRVNTKVKQHPESVPQLPLSLNYACKVDSKITITYQVKTRTYASVTIYDAQGVKMAQLASGFHEPALYTVNFKAGNCAHGIYFCRVSVGNGYYVRKIVIAR